MWLSEISFVVVLLLLLLLHVDQGESFKSTLIYKSESTPLTALYSAPQGQKGFFNHAKNFYSFKCEVERPPFNPARLTAVPSLNSDVVYLNQNFYTVISTQIWKIKTDDVMVAVYSNNGEKPFDFVATSTHLLYFLEGKNGTAKLYQSDGEDNTGVAKGSPNRITNIFSVNGKGFISGPGALHYFNPTDGAILLSSFCDANVDANCESPRSFVFNGADYVYIATGGLWATNTVNTAKIICSTPSCLVASHLVSYKNKVIFFSQSGKNLTVNVLEGMNQTRELSFLEGYTLETSSRSNWISSSKLIFVLYNSRDSRCVEFWQVTDNLLVSLMKRLCAEGSQSLQATNLHEAPRVARILFQTRTTFAAATTTIDIWELDTLTGTTSSVANVCAESDSSCDFKLEYVQTLQEDCLAHWSIDGLNVRAGTLSSSAVSSFSSSLFSLVVLSLSLLFTF